MRRNGFRDLQKGSVLLAGEERLSVSQQCRHDEIPHGTTHPRARDSPSASDGESRTCSAFFILLVSSRGVASLDRRNEWREQGEVTTCMLQCLLPLKTLHSCVL